MKSAGGEGEFESCVWYAGTCFRRVDTARSLGANRRQLLEAGVAAEKIAVVGSVPDARWMGWGGEGIFAPDGEGFTGRMLSVVE